ncbi:hypothetical protein P7K49_000408 [Saguinus oedipus]|uniref:Uncharacterized protein n=1 Tax=Saguinus oedipus TaxID=9490 RepID=A0ABQ9WBP7_SAGOE|nr:hypothetical protein P7K49_000408 [Saguinus oedipus]
MGELHDRDDRDVREIRDAVLCLGSARSRLRLEQEHLLEDITHEKAQALWEECGYLRRHRQIQGCASAQAQVQAETRDALKCDVTSALRKIRAQLEGHAVQSTLQRSGSE